MEAVSVTVCPQYSLLPAHLYLLMFVAMSLPHSLWLLLHCQCWILTGTGLPWPSYHGQLFCVAQVRCRAYSPKPCNQLGTGPALRGQGVRGEEGLFLRSDKFSL